MARSKSPHAEIAFNVIVPSYGYALANQVLIPGDSGEVMKDYSLRINEPEAGNFRKWLGVEMLILFVDNANF